MEHIAAVLLIIGCSDNLAQCRELPAPTPIYEAREECDADLPYSLGAFTGQFEQLFAQCIPVDPALEEEEVDLIWDIQPDGTLVASIEAVGATVVSNSQGTGQGYD